MFSHPSWNGSSCILRKLIPCLHGFKGIEVIGVIPGKSSGIVCSYVGAARPIVPPVLVVLFDPFLSRWLVPESSAHLRADRRRLAIRKALHKAKAPQILPSRGLSGAAL